MEVRTRTWEDGRQVGKKGGAGNESWDGVMMDAGCHRLDVQLHLNRIFPITTNLHPTILR
jgi:hypothetical protein